MTAFVDDWEDRVATCVAHLRSALLILDDLARHPQSALEDAFAYDLASRATCIALVSLDEGQPSRRTRDFPGLDVPAGWPAAERPAVLPRRVRLGPQLPSDDPGVGSLLWTASSEATGDDLDLHVTATHLLPGSYSPTGGAIVLAVSVVTPESRGTFRLASRDPHAAPLIDANYLGTERDARRMLQAVILAGEIGRNEVFARLTAGEIIPGDAVTDDALPEVIPSNIAVYGHPTSTVPMGGPADPWGVVDSVDAVKGLSGLRVVDASMPEVPSSVTNLTTTMVAERIFERVCAGSSSLNASGEQRPRQSSLPTSPESNAGDI